MEERAVAEGGVGTGECGRLEVGTVCGRGRRDPEVRRSGRGGMGATNGTAGL